MKWLIPAIATITAIAIIAYDPTPVCEISIKPDGTWEWTGTPTECHFPDWGTFHPDGTWEAH